MPDRAVVDDGTGKSLQVERVFTVSVRGWDSQTLLYGIQEYLVFLEQQAWSEDSHRKHCLFSSLEESLRQQDAG